MNSEERVERNANIVAARARGLGWRVIGHTFGMHEDACRRIVRDARAATPSIECWDMREHVQELLDAFDGAIEELALEAARAEGAARVRAVKARMDLQGDKFALLHDVAGRPRLDVIPQERDIQAITVAIIQVLNANGIPSDVQLQIADAVAAVRRDDAASRTD